MKSDLSDYISIICGYLTWSGGDSAIFDAYDISHRLTLEEDLTLTALDYMLDRGFVVREGNKCRLTKQGSFLVDFSLSEIIMKWAFKAELDAQYPFRTLQWMFLRSKFLPPKLPYGIRSAYVLDFCSSILQYITEKTPYSISDYSIYREFIMRASLRPIYSFLNPKNNETTNSLIATLNKNHIAKIEPSADSMLLFNVELMKIGENVGRAKRKGKENTQ